MTIQRYYIDERGIAKSDTGEWVRASDVDAMFKPGVAYIPVPRCDRCAHWREFEGLWPPYLVLPLLGDCAQSTSDGSKMSAGSRIIKTQHDFGCVQWKAKT
jgi:hypothetical protein